MLTYLGTSASALARVIIRRWEKGAFTNCEGRYPLSTQFGPDYRSVGYTDDETHPMPGFLYSKQETARISWCIQAIDQVCICPASDASI